MGRPRKARKSTPRAAGEAGKRPGDGNEAVWDRAIVILLKTPIFEKAAAEIGVSTTTLREWRRDPEFVRRFLEARNEAFGHGIATVMAEFGKSVDVLRQLRDAKKGGGRYAAAAKLIDMALGSYEAERLATRLERMRELIIELGGEQRLRELGA